MRQLSSFCHLCVHSSIVDSYFFSFFAQIHKYWYCLIPQLQNFTTDNTVSLNFLPRKFHKFQNNFEVSNCKYQGTHGTWHPNNNLPLVLVAASAIFCIESTKADIAIAVDLKKMCTIITTTSKMLNVLACKLKAIVTVAFVLKDHFLMACLSVCTGYSEWYFLLIAQLLYSVQ